MKKQSYSINLPYTFAPQRKGAKYYIIPLDKWGNAGDFIECATKYALGLPFNKDANGRYDKGSDIPELNASVKSSKFTLTTAAIGNNFDEILDNYFATCPSTLWIYGVKLDDTLITYEMNAIEFRQFVKVWCSYDNYRGQIRCKATSGKMLVWLDERATTSRRIGDFLSTVR